jgi:hypothetical protein
MSFKFVQLADGTCALRNQITGIDVATISAADVIALNATAITMTRESIAATGSTSANGASITKQISTVTAADNTKAVVLPAAATTQAPLLIVNTVTTATLPVFPVDGGNDQINGGAEDAAWVLGPGQSSWFIPVSATQWWAAPVSGGGAAQASRTVTGTATITAADHNKVIFINNATGFVTTLPAPIAGFQCEVINKTANTSGDHTIVTPSSTNIIKGMAFNGEAAGVGDAGTADDTISFVANSSVAGDRVTLRCDGTSWFAYAHSTLAASITFTQAST